MRKARWIGVITVGSLLPAAGFADGAAVPAAVAEPAPAVTVSMESLYARLPYMSSQSILLPADAMAYSINTSGPIAEIDFQDNSTLGRVRNLRGFSLLTLAEIGKSRLFFGVNDDGVVGLHFNVLPRDSDARYLEVMRMPYLKDE